MRLKSMSGVGGPIVAETVDASLERDGRGIEVEASAGEAVPAWNALNSARGTVAAPPRVQKCSCDGGGWIVTLDRGRYKAPGTAEMVRFTRCIYLDYASSPALSGGPVPFRGAPS